MNNSMDGVVSLATSSSSGDSSPVCNVKPAFLNNSEALLIHLAKLWDDESSSDVTLSVGGRNYKLHRHILSQSPVFSTMLLGSRWEESSSPIVNLNEQEEHCNHVEAFLKFFYTGQLAFSWDNIQSLLYFGDKYAMESIIKGCLAFIDLHIRDTADINCAFNAWKMTRDIVESRNMQCDVFTFLLHNFELFMGNEELLKSLDKYDMSILLQSSNIACRTEFTVFKTLERWLLLVKSDMQQRWSAFSELIAMIRLPYMKFQELGYVENSLSRLFPAIGEEQMKQMTTLLKSLLCDAYKNLAIDGEIYDENEYRAAHANLPPSRVYTESRSCLRFRLTDLHALSTWSKIEKFYRVPVDQATGADASFAVTLMRKIKATGFSKSTDNRDQKSFLSLAISQEDMRSLDYTKILVFLHEYKESEKIMRYLTTLSVPVAPPARNLNVTLQNLPSYDDIAKESSIYRCGEDGRGRMVYLAVDIALIK